MTNPIERAAILKRRQRIAWGFLAGPFVLVILAAALAVVRQGWESDWAAILGVTLALMVIAFFLSTRRQSAGGPPAGPG